MPKQDSSVLWFRCELWNPVFLQKYFILCHEVKGQSDSLFHELSVFVAWTVDLSPNKAGLIKIILPVSGNHRDAYSVSYFIPRVLVFVFVFNYCVPARFSECDIAQEGPRSTQFLALWMLIEMWLFGRMWWEVHGPRAQRAGSGLLPLVWLQLPSG